MAVYTEEYVVCSEEYFSGFSGRYIRTEETLNGLPLWRHSEKSHQELWSNDEGRWQLSPHYLQSTQPHDLAAPGEVEWEACVDGQWMPYPTFQIVGSGDAVSAEALADAEDGEEGTCELVGAASLLDSWVRLEEWECIPGHSFGFKSCVNSGAVYTDEDMQRVRRECLEQGYGGYHLRKAYYDAEGKIDTHQVAFYIQRTQAELHEKLEADPQYDAFIAPAAYTPDTSFRPYAPSCYSWWGEYHGQGGGKNAHAFAVQIRVDDPTPATFYMAVGFWGGYCGMQHHNATHPESGKHRQQILFSVWGQGHDVSTRYAHPGVYGSEFGGAEGSGGGAYCNANTGDATDCELAEWLPGEAVTFIVRARSAEAGTDFTCEVHRERTGWMHFATHYRIESEAEAVDSRGGLGRLTGFNSFIEAFGDAGELRRSGIWAAWVQHDEGGSWAPMASVMGTSTMDHDYPNTRVAPCGAEGIEMVSGGPALDDDRGCDIYSGDCEPVPVPDFLSTSPLA